MTREFIRRIQIMRKEMGLTRMDSVIIYANVDNEMKELLQRNKENIKHIVKAKEIKTAQEMPAQVHKKECDILGAKVELGIGKT